MITVAERVEEIVDELPPLTDAECVELGHAVAAVLAGAKRQQAA